MKCQYCQRACRRIAPGKALAQTKSQVPGSNTATYWQCDYHGEVAVKFMAARDRAEGVEGAQDWITTILVCLWKDNTYHVCFFHNNPDMEVKFRIDKVRSKPTWLISADAVVSLNFLPPDITPENVVNKLPTYLLFS
jgi:hypothetical protein